MTLSIPLSPSARLTRALYLRFLSFQHSFNHFQNVNPCLNRLPWPSCCTGCSILASTMCGSSRGRARRSNHLSGQCIRSRPSDHGWKRLRLRNGLRRYSSFYLHLLHRPWRFFQLLDTCPVLPTSRRYFRKSRSSRWWLGLLPTKDRTKQRQVAGFPRRFQNACWQPLQALWG